MQYTVEYFVDRLKKSLAQCLEEENLHFGEVLTYIGCQMKPFWCRAYQIRTKQHFQGSLIRIL